MDFSTVAAELCLTPGQKENFMRLWDASERTFPEVPEFLEAPFICDAFARLRYPVDLTEKLIAAAAQIRAVPALAHLAWHLHYRTFRHPDGFLWLPGAPIAETLLGEEGSGLFNLLIALSSVPLIRQTYARLGIPAEYAENHVTWLAGTIDIFRAAHGGRYGHSLNQTAWLRGAINGELFRIGRFEFRLEPYPQWVPAVYVHRATGKIAVLARTGWKYSQTWRRLPDRSGDVVHVARIEESPDSVRGVGLRCDGTVDPAPRTLGRREWEPIATPWQTIATFHIPGGGGMTPGKIREAFAEAVNFFRKYLNLEIPLFACESWILNPEWRQVLPGSNLAKFQRSVFTVDNPPNSGKSGLFFVFGREDVDPETHPAHTSLERAMLRVLQEGRPLAEGVMLLPAAAVAEYGHPERF